MKQMNKQAGFTLIELIIVIVILGILSAFALPRFADMATEAREASLQGLAGSLKAASAISHSQWLVDDSGDMGQSVTLEGAAITMIGSYPTADADGISKAAQVDDADYPATGGAATSGNVITYTLQTGCTVTYKAAEITVAAPAPAPDTLDAAPVVTVDATGC